MIDRRPGKILQPASADDLAAKGNRARDHGTLLAIRGGGHSASTSNATCVQA